MQSKLLKQFQYVTNAALDIFQGERLKKDEGLATRVRQQIAVTSQELAADLQADDISNSPETVAPSTVQNYVDDVKPSTSQPDVKERRFEELLEPMKNVPVRRFPEDEEPKDKDEEKVSEITKQRPRMVNAFANINFGC